MTRKKTKVPVWGKDEKDRNLTITFDEPAIMFTPEEKDGDRRLRSESVDPHVVCEAELPREMTKNQFQRFIRTDEGRSWAEQRVKEAWEKMDEK